MGRQIELGMLNFSMSPDSLQGITENFAKFDTYIPMWVGIEFRAGSFQFSLVNWSFNMHSLVWPPRLACLGQEALDEVPVDFHAPAAIVPTFGRSTGAYLCALRQELFFYMIILH